MSTTAPKYERLTRARFGLNGMGSLWLGQDHVLLVSTTFAVERYRRWYFREVQAFVLRRTSMRLVWNAIFGLGALFFLGVAVASLIGSSTSTASDDVIVLAVMAGALGLIGLAFVVAAAINSAMGPSCTVFVQTPHGLDRLSTPTRVPAFEKLSGRLQPLLLTAQTSPGDRSDTLREIAAALDQPQL
jgi:hypothetical protein